MKYGKTLMTAENLCWGGHFVRTLCQYPSVLDGPTWYGSYFIELDKAVVHVINLVSFL